VSRAENRKQRSPEGNWLPPRQQRSGKTAMVQRSAAFSLVEVNLAIFVVSIGLLTLFSLFPAGMKEGEAAHGDTQAALFADYVLSSLRGNATQLDAQEWNDIPGGPALWSGLAASVGGPTALQFPSGSGLYVRYRLEIVPNGDLYSVSLWVASGQYGTQDVDVFKNNAEWYYTELFFSGMP